MTKLRSLSGAVVDAQDSAVADMLNSGFFALCDGESVPLREPEDAPRPTEEQEDEADGIDFSAFGGGEDEDENLEAMTRAELIDLAHSLGLAVPNRATKAAIIDAINEIRG